MASIYDRQPYQILKTLAGGDLPWEDGSGKLSIVLETLRDVYKRQRSNISEKGAMPMDFSWELLFELLGKIADTISDVFGGTKKD